MMPLISKYSKEKNTLIVEIDVDIINLVCNYKNRQNPQTNVVYDLDRDRVYVIIDFE